MMRFSPSLAVSMITTTLLAGCGYSPMYAPAASTTAQPGLALGTIQMAAVSIEPGQRRVAQEVRERLAQSYPDIVADAARIDLTIQEATTTLALQRTATVQRAQINLTGGLEVKGTDGQTLLSTSLASSAAYNVENNPFSTESGKAYARQVAARNLADAVVRRLALWQRTR